jgi:hypothetical protein
VRTLVIALVLLCACALEPVAIVPFDTREEPGFSDVEVACVMWGLDCYISDDRIGAVALVLTDRYAHDVDGDGETSAGIGPDLGHGCKRLAWASGSPRVMAHELGHEFGLRHVDDPTNVMHDPPGSEVEDWQVKRVQRNAQRLSGCIGSKRVP